MKFSNLKILAFEAFKAYNNINWNENMFFFYYCLFLDLCIPGKLPVSEEILKKGGIFMRNEDINCIPMCKW